MKRKTLYQTVAATTSFVAIAVSLLFSSGKITSLIKKTNAAEQSYTMTLNSSAFASSGLGSDFNTADPKKFSDADYVQQTFASPGSPVVNYFLAKKDSSDNLVLAPGGQVFNYSSTADYNGRVTAITSLTVNYSGGALYAQDGDAGSYTIYNKRVAITSGTPVTFESKPNFVMISNSRANTTISSISFTYSCLEPGYIVGRLGEIYNGAASNGTAYTLTRSGSSVTLNGLTGSISVSNNGSFTMSFSNGSTTYSGTISPDYRTLAITGRTGSALEINEFNRVYVMDDFEGYSQTGTGLRSGKTVASDLRFAYYGDYGGGGYSSWVTSSSFDSAQSADYLNLTTAVKHGGSKSATFKGWTGGWTRAWSRETFDMHHHYNFGIGNKVSFWTHGAYTNTACTSASSNNVTIRVQFYYQKFEINDSNRSSTTYGTGAKDFTVNANSDWTERTISLGSDKNIYAINVMVNNSGLSTNVFVPIDDITIQTNPIYAEPKTYEETSTRFTRSYKGSVQVSSYTFDIKIALGANGYIYAYAGADMQPTSYTITGTQIVIETTGSYSGLTFGTWTGTLSNSNKTISISKNNITGSIKQSVKTDTIVLNETTVLANGSESNSVLLQTLGKQYNNGSWTNYGSLSGELQNASTYHIEGNGAIEIAPYTGGKVRVYANPTTAQSVSAFKDFSFWYYVPVGVKYVVSLYGLNTNGTPPASGSASQAYTITYAADSGESGWHYMSMGIPSGYRKNVFIYIECSVTTYIDYLTYYVS